MFTPPPLLQHLSKANEEDQSVDLETKVPAGAPRGLFPPRDVALGGGSGGGAGLVEGSTALVVPRFEAAAAPRNLATVTVTTQANLVANLKSDTTIELGADIFLTRTIDITSGQTGLVIDGMGLYKVDGNGNVGCFNIENSTTEVVVQNLVITNGYTVIICLLIP